MVEKERRRERRSRLMQQGKEGKKTKKEGLGRDMEKGGRGGGENNELEMKKNEYRQSHFHVAVIFNTMQIILQSLNVCDLCYEIRIHIVIFIGIRARKAPKSVHLERGKTPFDSIT